MGSLLAKFPQVTEVSEGFVLKFYLGIFSLLLILSGALWGAGYYPPSSVVLGPWYGSGCPDYGVCACGDAKTLSEESTCQLDQLLKNDIPVTVYLFDGSGWSKANSYGTQHCEGVDCCNWNLGTSLIQRLQRDSLRVFLHFWGGCHSSAHYQRAYDSLGSTLLGFYLDDGCSDAEAKQAIDWMNEKMPGNMECNLKAFQTSGFSTSTISDSGLRFGNVCYVNDLATDFAGLKEGIRRVFEKSTFLAGPFNEFTAYSWGPISDEETYSRRLHFGCFQVVMANTPLHNEDPWDKGRFGNNLVETYKYYSWLHWELVPYLYSYVYAMHEQPENPLFRSPNAGLFSTMLGDELFVTYVTDYLSTMDIMLPQGTWIDYWDELKQYRDTIRNFSVPVGREPIFIRSGAIIPMRIRRSYTGHGTNSSNGNLTVLVYPDSISTFRFREEETKSWITFTSRLNGNKLTIDVTPKPPKKPVLYRIGRWMNPPMSISLSGTGIRINQGGSLPIKKNEDEVNSSSSSAWFYNAAENRLIVKYSVDDTTQTRSQVVRQSGLEKKAIQEIELYALNGKKVGSFSQYMGGASYHRSIRSLPKGVYLARKTGGICRVEFHMLGLNTVDRILVK